MRMPYPTTDKSSSENIYNVIRSKLEKLSAKGHKSVSESEIEMTLTSVLHECGNLSHYDLLKCSNTNITEIVSAWNSNADVFGVRKIIHEEVNRIRVSEELKMGDCRTGNCSWNVHKPKEGKHVEKSIIMSGCEDRRINPVVLSSIIIAITLLIIAIIIHQPSERYKSIGNGLILDSKSGEVHIARPVRK